MSFKEFKGKICKEKGIGKKVCKVRNSWGAYDVYKHIRKNGWYHIGRPVTEHEFYSIIRKVNDLLAEELALGNTVSFPARMGQLELRKIKNGASIIDGKLVIKYPVDWDKTIHLWYEDNEAYQNKILIRQNDPYMYRVKYNKYKATYENKSFYEFALNRFIKRALKKNIKAGKTETLY